MTERGLALVYDEAMAKPSLSLIVPPGIAKQNPSLIVLPCPPMIQLDREPLRGEPERGLFQPAAVE